MRLELVSSGSTDEALRYLAQRPHDNVYIHWLLSTGQLLRAAQLLICRDAAGAIRGACSFGAQIMPTADEPETLEAFGERARACAASARMFVGRRADVEKVWSHARSAFPVPTAIRTSQPLYALSRERLRFGRMHADVALGTYDEVDELAQHAAAMITGEMSGAVVLSKADFRSRTARIVEAGRLWRYRHGGRLAFMCYVGGLMPAAAQIQGVWTPPDMRGRGHATRALGAICDYLLDSVPSLCLYVNDYNTRAIALYERIGFQRVGEFQTILLGL